MDLPHSGVLPDDKPDTSAARPLCGMHLRRPAGADAKGHMRVQQA